MAGKVFGQRLHQSKTAIFLGKKKDWPLFKMQLQAYVPIFGLQGVLEERFDKDFPARQDYILDVTDMMKASKSNTGNAN